MNKGKKIGYIRVSTVDQNPERQLDGIKLDKRFIDFCTGTTINRPALKQMLEYVREDDVIVVHSMDRLGRQLKDILDLCEFFMKNGIQLEFIKEGLKFTGKDDPMSRCILMIFGAVAEFEYSLIRERQKEGIAIAKAAGKFKGRKRSLNDEQIKEMYDRIQKCTHRSKASIARDFKISRYTMYQYILEVEGKETRKQKKMKKQNEAI